MMLTTKKVSKRRGEEDDVRRNRPTFSFVQRGRRRMRTREKTELKQKARTFRGILEFIL